jgi:predicted nucleotidyltransferase
MMPADAPLRLPELVQRTLERLIRAFSPERIVLFGSYAKGTIHAGSDVDLLVIASLPGNRDQHQKRARQLGAGCFPPVDIVLATPADFEERPGSRLDFLLSILAVGITLYDRVTGTGPKLRS